MPGGDRTGPMGMGPMTGRGAGYCAGYGGPGYVNPIPRGGFGRGWRRGGRGGGWGRGWGGGWGGGRGWRHGYYATGLPGWVRYGAAPAWGGPPPPAYGPYAAAAAPTQPPTRQEEAQWLRAQADLLKEELEAISQRITELESEE